MNLDDVRLLELPKILDERGNLTFLQNQAHIPFDIKRTYWIYDVPGGAVRGGHAYYRLEEVIIALSGSFDIVLDDGVRKEKYTLNRSYYGLYVPKLIWRQLVNFSTNSLALIVANALYDPEDYIREYDLYQRMNHGR